MGESGYRSLNESRVMLNHAVAMGPQLLLGVGLERIPSRSFADFPYFFARPLLGPVQCDESIARWRRGYSRVHFYQVLNLETRPA